MLVRLNDEAYVDPGEVAALTVGYRGTQILFRSGTQIELNVDLKDAAEALAEAGAIETGADWPILSEEDLRKLRILDGDGWEYIARDADGKLYAFKQKPQRLGAYWEGEALGHPKPMRITEGLDGIDDSEAWSIAFLLAQ